MAEPRGLGAVDAMLLKEALRTDLEPGFPFVSHHDYGEPCNEIDHVELLLDPKSLRRLRCSHA